MSRRFTCLFSFYGGKSRIVHRYPDPVHDTVIEPFAGGASYSLRHHERQVWINEKDPVTRSMWEFVLSSDSADWVEGHVPETVHIGDKASEMIPRDAPAGLLEILRSQANMGTQGARGIHDQVTMIGQIGWPRLKPRLMQWIPLVAHWKLTGLDYSAVATDDSATWFVDPPYNNSAGRRYRLGMQSDEFGHLARWVDTLRGQVIVCENGGADWLPFEPLVARQGVRGRYQKSKAMEVVYIR